MSAIAHTKKGLVLACACVLTGCATLPDTDALIAQHGIQTARFESALGPVSAKRSATITAELKRTSGDIDLLDKQIALEQGTNGSPLTLGNKASLLQDGTATYAAMFAAIRQAKDHINLESYIIEDDDAGQEFATLLLQTQARGVQVNLIYDSVGGINTPKIYFERLSHAGVAVLEFNPINPLIAKGAWQLNQRDHRKLLLVDGRIAILGGINISSVYASGSARRRTGKSSTNHVQWRDTDIQIEGPVVAEFQKMFLQTWAKQNGAPLAQKNYFPTLTPQGKDIVRAIGSTADDPYSLIYLTLISAIGNSEKHVRLTNAYFVPDPQLLLALTDAAARGVDVQLILPSQSDSSLVFHAGRAHYADLLHGGVQIFERQGALLHSKTALIDGVWSTVGSTNLDWRSFLSNDEVNAVILGHDFAAQMQAMFNKDLDASVRIEPQGWANRPLNFKFKEWLAHLWARLL
jgi:cardiolipin synthase